MRFRGNGKCPQLQPRAIIDGATGRTHARTAGRGVTGSPWPGRDHDYLAESWDAAGYLWATDQRPAVRAARARRPMISQSGGPTERDPKPLSLSSRHQVSPTPLVR